MVQVVISAWRTRLCSDENRDVRIGIFPEREEILISCAGFGGVALHGVSARKPQPGQRTDGFVSDYGGKFMRRSRA